MRKKLFLLLSLVLLLGVNGVNQVRAENSAAAYEKNLRAYQVFVDVYNNDTVTLSKNAPVIIDTSGTAGTTLGAMVKATTTTDSVNVFGVADEAITAGTMGRVCIRGPHKVQCGSPSGVSAGALFSTSTTTQQAAPYTTSDGNVGGRLGYILSATASTDTGDTNVYWLWVNPEQHK